MVKNFVTINVGSGSGNKSVSVTASKNKGAARSTTLNVKVNSITKTVVCSQGKGFDAIIVGNGGNIVSVNI